MTNDQEPKSDEAVETGGAKNRPPSRPPVQSPATFGVVAVLAALTGFAAIYVNMPSGGNETSPATETGDASTVTSGEQKAPASTTSSLTEASLKAYARGDMATFVAKKAPAQVAAVAFRDFSSGDDGIAKSMEDWKGKVVLLNLWATWCAPCRKEMPDLLALKNELGGKDFDVVPVSIDRGGPEKPRKFLNQINAQALGLFQSTSSEIVGPLKAFGMPTTILFDRQGRELGRLVGPADWSSADAKALIKAAIARSGAS